MKVYTNVIDAKGLEDNERRAVKARQKTPLSAQPNTIPMEKGQIKEATKHKKSKTKV